MPTALSRPFRALLAVGLALSVVGTSCELTLGPSRREAGTYVLVSVDGRPLPYTLHYDADEIRRLQSDVIELDGRGRALRLTIVEHFWRGQDLSTRSRSELEYRIDGDAITLGSFGSCSPIDFCGGTEEGTFYGDELVLTTGWLGARRRYVRVSDCRDGARLDACRTDGYTVDVPRPDPESR